MEDRIKEIIETKIRPALQMDGGDIELVGVDGGQVKVRLQGACHGCPSAAMTLQMGVKRLLQQEIPEIEDVIPV
jgi:Fe-S cluster biogenesis protein NfuA